MVGLSDGYNRFGLSHEPTNPAIELYNKNKELLCELREALLVTLSTRKFGRPLGL